MEEVSLRLVPSSSVLVYLSVNQAVYTHSKIPFTRFNPPNFTLLQKHAHFSCLCERGLGLMRI